MRLFRVCLIIVFALSTLTVLADGTSKKRKVLEKPYTGEARLRPGEPSVDFCFSDINGKPVSLKSLKGKYVYIDMWATWCSPCRAEIPFLKKLEKTMKGEKIVFVSLSTDQNKAVWEKFVKENDMDGIQLFAGDKGKEMMSFYVVESIPRFILLDKKGRIVDAFMTRPSNEKTKETLMKLKGI